MKYNTKIKIIFSSLMIISGFIGMYGIINMIETMNSDGNVFLIGLVLVPILGLIGVALLKQGEK